MVDRSPATLVRLAEKSPSVGQVGEAISNRLQDTVELVMLSDQLVPVHPVVAHPRRQRRIEQRVLVGVVRDQLLSIVVVELPHAG